MKSRIGLEKKKRWGFDNKQNRVSTLKLCKINEKQNRIVGKKRWVFDENQNRVSMIKSCKMNKKQNRNVEKKRWVFDDKQNRLNDKIMQYE